MRIAIYARVSTDEQNEANQLLALRDYVVAQGWDAVEFLDPAVSGATESRPALDEMLGRVRRKEFDVVLAWRLDRLGRDSAHLLTLRKEFRKLGVGIVTLGEGIDTRQPGGILNYGLRALFAEEERERISDRTRAGLRRARANGRTLGRPRKQIDMNVVASLSIRKAAQALGVSEMTILRRRQAR